MKKSWMVKEVEEAFVLLSPYIGGLRADCEQWISNRRHSSPKFAKGLGVEEGLTQVTK